MTPLSLYMESSPNPHSLKFVANRMLLQHGKILDFPTAASANQSPLAQSLFMFPFVQRVFITANFVTITKSEEVEWLEVQDTLRNHIQQFIQSEQPIDHTTHELTPEEESEVVLKIKDILEEYVRPAVEQDGGAITFHSYQDKKVSVLLRGSCSGCPSSTVTLKSGIENLFKQMMPDEVEEVLALNE